MSASEITHGLPKILVSVSAWTDHLNRSLHGTGSWLIRCCFNHSLKETVVSLQHNYTWNYQTIPASWMSFRDRNIFCAVNTVLMKLDCKKDGPHLSFFKTTSLLWCCHLHVASLRLIWHSFVLAGNTKSYSFSLWTLSLKCFIVSPICMGLVLPGDLIGFRGRPPTHTPVFCVEHFHRVCEVCILHEFTAIIPQNMMSRLRVTLFAPFMHVLQALIHTCSLIGKK